jgi:hypothetical protein
VDASCLCCAATKFARSLFNPLDNFNFHGTMATAASNSPVIVSLDSLRDGRTNSEDIEDS